MRRLPRYHEEHLDPRYHTRSHTHFCQTVWGMLIGGVVGCPLVALLILACKGVL